MKYIMIRNINMLFRLVNPYDQWPIIWKDMVQMTGKYVPNIKIVHVQWLKPTSQWVKLNSDGSSLLNPGLLEERESLETAVGNYYLLIPLPWVKKLIIKLRWGQLYLV